MVSSRFSPHAKRFRAVKIVRNLLHLTRSNPLYALLFIDTFVSFYVFSCLFFPFSSYLGTSGPWWMTKYNKKQNSKNLIWSPHHICGCRASTYPWKQLSKSAHESLSSYMENQAHGLSNQIKSQNMLDRLRLVDVLFIGFIAYYTTPGSSCSSTFMPFLCSCTDRFYIHYSFHERFSKWLRLTKQPSNWALWSVAAKHNRTDTGYYCTFYAFRM